MPSLLAIDPSTSTGFAYVGSFDPSGAVHYGTWVLRQHEGQRLIEFRGRLDALHMAEKFERIGYETPFVGRFPAAARSLYHLEGAILSWAAAHDLPCDGYTPREIKRAVATGGASKERVIQRVQWLGFHPQNDHEADAIALLRLMQSGAKPMGAARKEAVREQRKRVDDLFRASRSVRRRIST